MTTDKKVSTGESVVDAANDTTNTGSKKGIAAVPVTVRKSKGDPKAVNDGPQTAQEAASVDPETLVPDYLKTAWTAAQTAQVTNRQQMEAADVALYRTLGEVAAIVALVGDKANDIKAITDAAGIQWPNRGNVVALAIVKYMLFRDSHGDKNERSRHTKYAAAVAKLVEGGITTGEAAVEVLRAAGGVAGYITPLKGGDGEGKVKAKAGDTLEAVMSRLDSRSPLASFHLDKPLSTVNGYALVLVRVSEGGDAGMIGPVDVSAETFTALAGRVAPAEDLAAARAAARKAVLEVINRVKSAAGTAGRMTVTVEGDTVSVSVKKSADGFPMIATGTSGGVIEPGRYEFDADEIKDALNAVRKYAGTPVVLPGGDATDNAAAA